MTKTTTRARYTLEFKQEAVRLVEGGQSKSVGAERSGGWRKGLTRTVGANVEDKSERR